MATIELEVDPELAQAYLAVPPQERLMVQTLLKLRLREIMKAPRRPLNEIMDQLGREAQERGLTPEILESILQDE